MLFAQLSVAAGTLVVNDPVQPRQRRQQDLLPALPGGRPPAHADLAAIRTTSARSSRSGRSGAVLKPLQGSGGTGVFFVSDDESPNLNQMIEAVGRDGYIVAQEYLAGRRPGRRAPLPHERRAARRRTVTTRAFRRVNADRRPRARTCASAASPSRSRSTTRCSQVAEAVRPKLLADGMFLVGLDIVGDKLMEVNVFSPGGLGSCETLYGTRFTDAVIDALEHKVELRHHYGNTSQQRQPRHALSRPRSLR